MLWICWYSSAEKLMETEKTEEKLKTGLKFPFQTEKFPKTRFSFRYGGVFFLKRRKISDLFSIFQYFAPRISQNCRRSEATIQRAAGCSHRSQPRPNHSALTVTG